MRKRTCYICHERIGSEPSDFIEVETDGEIKALVAHDSCLVAIDPEYADELQELEEEFTYDGSGW